LAVYGTAPGQALLLELLALETSGFMFGDAAVQKRRSGDLGSRMLLTWTRQPVPSPVPEALDELLRLGEPPRRSSSTNFVLVAATPRSFLPAASTHAAGHAKQHTMTRLILCGSAVTTMTQLLAAVPLAPSADELVCGVCFASCRVLDAADHPNSRPAECPSRLNSAYKTVRGAGPRSLGEFDSGATSAVSPASAMFRKCLAAREPSITTRHHMLQCRRDQRRLASEIAAALARPSTPWLTSSLGSRHRLIDT